MALNRKYVFAISIVASLTVATSGFALTLGRAKGAVSLGQALQLTVPVQMQAGDGATALCFEADVFYGDTRQDASRVVVRSELFPQSQSAIVTVSASGAVDEPVVTVYLRAGCEQKTARRYVLLSNPAAPSVPPASTTNLPFASLLPRSESTSAFPLSTKDVVKTPAPSKRNKSETHATAPGDSKRSQSVPKVVKSPSGRSHLKLAPLDLTLEVEPALKLSDQLVVDGAEDLQQRSRAAALWGALNASTQDILNLEGRQQAMDLDLKSLQGVTAKNRQLLMDMTSRLDKAQAARYSNPLVYALLVAIAAMCLAIVLLWRRTRQDGHTSEPWWSNDVVADKPDAEDVAAADNSTVPPFEQQVIQKVQKAPAVPQKEVAPTPPSDFAHIDLDLQLDEPEVVAPSAQGPVAVRQDPVRAKSNQSLPRSVGHLDFGHSMSATLLRSINSKEMLDVRQQADFFMTLGQHDEAIALLRAHLDDDANANPLVYLELLKILHTLALKPEYDQYRKGFNAIFNGHVPVYADFNQVGSGLEAYPDVCQQIVALWPSAAAISYMEHCLLRTRVETGGQDFDLEAFRDLLMLHGVASRMASVTFDSGFVAFSATKPVPIPAPEMYERAVDVDLSESHNGNLIDFDASDWAPPRPPGANG